MSLCGQEFAGIGKDEWLKDGFARTDLVPIRKITQEAPRIGHGQEAQGTDGQRLKD